jgi:hypothetical protein
MDKKRKRKSLKLKAEHLKLELEDRKEESSRFEQEFFEILSKLEIEEIPHAPQKPLPTDPAAAPKVEVISFDEAGAEPEEIKLPETQIEHPEEFKKMWKQVASLTHPDKTGNDPEKTELYKKAAAAWSKGNYADLISVAMDIGIIPPEDSELGLEVLEKHVEDLEKQIKSTEDSVLWMWASAPANKKDQIIDLFLGSRGKKRKKS